jgi:Tol biopolymer transport system component
MPVRRSLRALAVFCALLLVLLAACGSPAVTPTPPSETGPSSTAPASAPTAASTPIASAATIAPARGLEGQIVFEDAGRDFQYSQVWIENADGSNVRKLVSDDLTDGAASFSPDGTVVAFDQTPTFSIDEVLADSRRADRIMLVNVDGTGLRRVATHPDRPDSCWDGIEGGAIFSPDGRRIVFSRLCPRTGVSGLWTVNVDGTGAREVTRDASSPRDVLKFLQDGTAFTHVEDHRASWSPDGKRLAFERIDASATSERAAIFTIGIDGKDLRQVTPWSVDANDPDWSPDGTMIALNASAEPSPTQNIWTVHPDGTGLTQLTTYDEAGQATFHPSWSPDGSHILFTHSPSTGGWGDFFVMDRDGANQHVIAETAMHENHGRWGWLPTH